MYIIVYYPLYIAVDLENEMGDLSYECLVAKIWKLPANMQNAYYLSKYLKYVTNEKIS